MLLVHESPVAILLKFMGEMVQTAEVVRTKVVIGPGSQSSPLACC